MADDVEGMGVMEGGERVDQSPVPTVGTRSQRFVWRSDAQVSASITADETDDAEDAEHPDVRHHGGDDQERRHQYADEDFDDHYAPHLLLHLVPRLYRDTITNASPRLLHR